MFIEFAPGPALAAVPGLLAVRLKQPTVAQPPGCRAPATRCSGSRPNRLWIRSTTLPTRQRPSCPRD